MVPALCAKTKCQGLSLSVTGGQGTKYLKHSLVSLRVNVNEKRELGIELELKPRHSDVAAQL